MGLKSKLLPLFIMFLLLILQYRLWFDDGGIMDMLAYKKKLAAQTAINTELAMRNADLLKQVQALQTNSDAIESRARHELGMIKKGETFYQVVP
jgi:cell division protein FtsB